MARVDVAFLQLEIVPDRQHLGRIDLLRRKFEDLDVRERRLEAWRAEVGPHEPSAFERRVGIRTDAVLERRSLGAVRHVDALAAAIELPTVVDAAQPVLLVTAPVQVRAAMRTVRGEQSDRAGGVAESDELFVEHVHADRW